MATTLDDVEQAQTTTKISAKMKACGTLPDVKHKHHVGSFDTKPGVFDFFRSLLSPGAHTFEVTLAINVDDLVKLSFQAPGEQRLPGKHVKMREKEDHDQSSNDSGYQSKDRTRRPSVCAVKAHRLDSPKGKQSSRRRSSSSASSSLPHVNILNKLDVLKNGTAITSEAMTAISGIHLGTVILHARKMGAEEADCYFKQLVRGTAYLHTVGVAHRDLKPENLLITTSGVLKIANFSNAECFREASKGRDEVKMSSKRCGSIQYMAPEVFVEASFDSRAVDMWAIGFIYMEMRTGKLFWELAAEGADESYDRYLLERESFWGYRPIQNLSNECCRRVIHSLLNPCPEKRLTSLRVLKSIWCVNTELCEAAMSERSLQE